MKLELLDILMTIMKITQYLMKTTQYLMKITQYLMKITQYLMKLLNQFCQYLVVARIIMKALYSSNRNYSAMILHL